MYQKTAREVPRTVPVAFRTSPDRKLLIEAAATRGRLFASEWLREVTDRALEAEGLLRRSGDEGL